VINKYNEAAATLTPPRPRLSFLNVISMTSLAELDLLRDTRQDLREQAWTQPARREAMVLYFGIKRAKEEVRRLNVEIRRLITFMVDEHVDYYRAISANIILSVPLALELQKRWLQTCRVSTSVCKRLATTSRLVGFSGSIFPGVRQGRDPDLADSIPPPPWLSSVLGITQIDVEYEEPDSRDTDMEPAYNEQEESELGVRVLDIEEDNVAELMERLCTFDDS
jgi:hypothetical protein